MVKADLIAIHKSTENIIGHAKTMQKLTEDGLSDETLVIGKMWMHDIRSTLSKMYEELDYTELVVKYNVKKNEREAK